MSFFNNYNYFFNLIQEGDEVFFNNVRYYYYINFFKKNTFNKKTNYGVKISKKINSLRRNKNLNFNNLLINSWVKKGLKLNFLKNYNIYLNLFYFLIFFNKNYFSEYPNFNFIYDLIKSNVRNSRIESLLEEPIYVLQHMFELRLKKLNKKMKKKHKKKHIYIIRYLHKAKRLKNTLNMFYLSSNNYNNKKYYDRIFFTFINIIFNTKNTPIFKKKINTYKIALKFLKKK